jgi:hypothetical protein
MSSVLRGAALLAGVLCAGAASAVEAPDREPDKVFDGKLEDGKVTDNAFATQSNVACFTGPNFEYFSGNQQFHVLTQPASTNAVISVEPEGEVDLSVYVLQLGRVNLGQRPPDVSAAWRCTTGYSKKAGKAEIVQLTGPKSEMEVVIAVAGAKGASEGAFKVKVWLDGPS